MEAFTFLVLRPKHAIQESSILRGVVVGTIQGTLGFVMICLTGIFDLVIFFLKGLSPPRTGLKELKRARMRAPRVLTSNTITPYNDNEATAQSILKAHVKNDHERFLHMVGNPDDKDKELYLLSTHKIMAVTNQEATWKIKYIQIRRIIQV